jgi:WD40 repeat protein
MSHSERHVRSPVHAAPRSEVTSISISPGRVALATTLGGTQPNPRNARLPGDVPAEVHIMVLTSSEEDHVQTEHDHRRLGFDLRVSFFWHDETDIWSSTANPFIGTESAFAVGMSNKVVLYSDGDRGWSDNSERMQTQSDAFAVEWLQPRLLAIGQRDGIVKLWDTRSSGQAAAALALQHSGAISNIKSADSQRIVVHGRCTENALCMYDLRYTTAITPSKRKRDAEGVRQQRVSQALLVYENEGNVRPVGFDISTGSGLVAAVDSKNKVQLYTLHNGDHVKNLESPGIAQGDGLPTRKLQFVTTRDGTEKLIGCTGGTMWSARS